MDQSGAADCRRRSFRCARRESVNRISRKGSSYNQGQTEGREERSYGSGFLSGHPRESNRRGNYHQTGEHKVQSLDPTTRPICEHAQGVSPEVKTISSKSLNQADREIKRAGYRTAK